MPIAAWLAGLALSLLVRYLVSGFVSQDFLEYTQHWYRTVQTEGFSAFGREFSDYTPPYLYLLYGLATWLPGLGALAATKVPGSVGDYVAAWLASRIVAHVHPATPRPAMAFFAVVLAPTVVLNSAAWGQSDSLYTAALLGTLALVLRDRPALAMVSFGVGIAFKLQAVFLLPFVFALLLRGRVRVRHLCLIPVPYAIAIVPAWLAGRSLRDLLLIFYRQASWDTALAVDAPNPYLWMPDQWATVVLPLGIGVAAALALGFAWVASRLDLDDDALVLIALGSVTLLPFALPHMHERYFYPADVFSIVLAFVTPQLWWVPLAAGGTSLLAYSRYLLGYALVPLGLLPLGPITLLAAILVRLNARRRA